MNQNLSYLGVSKDGIDIALEGEPEPRLRELKFVSDLLAPEDSGYRFFAVFDKSVSSYTDAFRPRLIVTSSSSSRDTLAWISTYHPDLSPVSQWCHVVSSDLLSKTDSLQVSPRFGGLEAAWAGATIGEIVARRGTSLSDISMVWCMSAATLAYARASCLWPEITTIESFIDLTNEARSLLRAEPRRELVGLSSVWRILTVLQNPASKMRGRLSGAQKAILEACKDVHESGSISAPSADLMKDYCTNAVEVAQVDELNAEDRVRLIDSLLPVVSDLEKKKDSDGLEILSFLVGYAVGRVGAGESNLSLLTPFNEKLPIASVWCPCIPGLYRPIPWGSALDGLGRLVTRQLSKPLYLTDQPETDISIDELRVKVNPRVVFRKLPFRPSSNRVAVVDLLPGVGLAVNLGSEWHGETAQPNESTRTIEGADKRLHAMAQELYSVLEKYSAQPKPQKAFRRRKARTSQIREPKLPLDEK